MPGKQHLFTVTHWLLNAAMALCAAIAVILCLVMFGLGVAAFVDNNHLGIPANMDGVARMDALAIGALGVAGVLVCVVLAFFAFRATAAIVQTAMCGDPFVKENARRLTAIGWLLIGFMAAQFLTNSTLHELVRRLAAQHHFSPSELGHFDFGSGMSGGGLLAVLLIFVLGQIFRRGSEMRAELEGTV